MNNEAKFFTLVDKLAYRQIVLEAYLDELYQTVNRYSDSIRLQEIVESKRAMSVIDQIKNELKFLEEALKIYKEK